MRSNVIQNSGLSAVALHKFAQSYHAAEHKLNGPKLSHFMPVLPILYNEDFLDAIYNRNFDGGFYSALSDHRDLPAGLQERMEKMADHTFAALNLSFASNMLTYNNEIHEVVPINRARKPSIAFSENKKIIRGADRLGYWFSSLSFDQICIHLKIRF